MALDISSTVTRSAHCPHLCSSKLILYCQLVFYDRNAIFPYFKYWVTYWQLIQLIDLCGQLLNVYAPKFETGGKFWPVVHDATIVFLILMQVIAIGIFGVKKLPVASSLTVPLPILTLLFNSYCRRRFLPSFKGFPAEVN